MLAWSMRRTRRREKTRLKRGLNVVYHVSLRTYAAIRRTPAVRPACSLSGVAWLDGSGLARQPGPSGPTQQFQAGPEPDL
jgi:hypothetical protein